MTPRWVEQDGERRLEEWVILEWDPDQHPRNRTGQFVNVLKQLHPGEVVKGPGWEVERTEAPLMGKYTFRPKTSGGRWRTSDDPQEILDAIPGGRTKKKRAKAKQAVLAEAKLTTKARHSLSKSAFVYPAEERYPINDLAHARNALARCSGKPEEATVKAAVYKRYPQLKKTQETRWVEHDGERFLLGYESGYPSDTALIEAADSLRKASQHKHGLEVKKGKADNWIERTGAGGHGGQLPAYIQHIALAIEKKGKTKSRAIAIAIGTVKRWAAGGGNVDSNTRAAAAKALAEWTALKAKAKAT